MQITKWVLANIIFPVFVGVMVASWNTSQDKIIVSTVAGLLTALICDFILIYPKITGYIKKRIKIAEHQKVSLVGNPLINNKISVELCTNVYILVRRIEIGTKDRWLIIHSDPFSLDAEKCKDIEFVKLYKSLEYFSLAETHEENEISFQRFRQGLHSFDFHVGFKFSKNGADHDRFWRLRVDYRESDQITLKIENVK